MKSLVQLSIILMLIIGSGCSMHRGTNGSTSVEPATPDTFEMTANQGAPTEPERYVQIIDELISSGCDISSFEMVEREKMLDVKVACK